VLLEQKIATSPLQKTSTASTNRQESEPVVDPRLSSGSGRIMESRSLVENLPDRNDQDITVWRDTRDRSYHVLEKKINIPLNLVGLLLSRKSPLKVQKVQYYSHRSHHSF
jgi:hypothetical protein